MLDLVQTLAILRLLDKDKQNDKKDNVSTSDGIFYIIITILLLPILFYGFPLVYTLIYLPYKFFTKEKTISNETLDNFTFYKYILLILTFILIISLFLAKIIFIETALTFLAFLFYIYMIVSFIIDLTR